MKNVVFLIVNVRVVFLLSLGPPGKPGIVYSSNQVLGPEGPPGSQGSNHSKASKTMKNQKKIDLKCGKISVQPEEQMHGKKVLGKWAVGDVLIGLNMFSLAKIAC